MNDLAFALVVTGFCFVGFIACVFSASWLIHRFSMRQAWKRHLKEAR